MIPHNGTTVAGALDELDAVDVALDRTGRPRSREGGVDGSAVGGEAVGECLEAREAAGARAGQPGIEPGQIARGDEAAEALEQVVAGRQVGVVGEDAG